MIIDFEPMVYVIKSFIISDFIYGDSEGCWVPYTLKGDQPQTQRPFWSNAISRPYVAHHVTGTFCTARVLDYGKSRRISGRDLYVDVHLDHRLKSQ